MNLHTFGRRQLLQGTLASFATASLGFDALAQNACQEKAGCASPPCKPKPTFSFPKAKALAGLRPHRDGSYRLRTETISGKHILHNYGHGGAGITMSWGCAAGVASRVETLINDGQLTNSGIAILGAGVMGLTAATALSKKYPGVKIDLYYESSYAQTTSNVAGGQFAPSSVEWDRNNEAADAAFKNLIRTSYQQFKSQIGSTYGVSEKINYTLYARGGLETAHDAGIIDHDPLNRLPFAGMNCSGHAYKTLLIEPPIFLKKLHNDLVARLGKGAFHPGRLLPPSEDEALSPDIAKLGQKIIVNCTGLGAGKLFKDPRVRPIKGHLLLLPAQPQLDYLFSGYDCHDWVQYMFPRRDGVVIGGTYQEDQNNTDTNEEVGKYMLRRIKRLFDGDLSVCTDSVDTATKVERQNPDA